MDELIYFQSLKLCKLVKHAYNTVPFYKKLFDNYEVHPDDIRSLEDIVKIPIIDKKIMVTCSFDELLSSKSKHKNLIPVKTAGSNGMPFLFYIDNSFDQFRKSQFLRPYITNDLKAWHSSIVFSVHDLTKKWYNHLGLLKNSRIDPGLPLNEQVKIIQEKKPNSIQGYGSALNLLSSYIIDNNISMPKIQLIFTDSELLASESRMNIERAFNTKVIDIYGTFETDNIAYECSYHQGYHMAIDSVIMEFLKKGQPVNPDEEGEIVVTVLNNYTIPFIRYNLHDIGIYTKKDCLCGRTFPIMTEIKGRANDYMINSDGSKLSYTTIAYFDKLAPNVREYQIVQEDFNLFNVFIVPGIEYKNQGEDIIATAIKKYFPLAEINVNTVSHIEREPSGKFKAFKSKVNNL